MQCNAICVPFFTLSLKNTTLEDRDTEKGNQRDSGDM